MRMMCVFCRNSDLKKLALFFVCISRSPDYLHWRVCSAFVLAVPQMGIWQNVVLCARVVFMVCGSDAGLELQLRHGRPV